LTIAPEVKTERWQGKDVSKDPAAVTHEIQNVCFEVPLAGVRDLAHWRNDTAANVPWADDHFMERIGGEPLNPGAEWARWPWANSADRHRTSESIFNHTYMERLWPKYARTTQGGELPIVYGSRRVPPRNSGINTHVGIAQRYGDLQDLVELLAKEPFTRQAYIPLFFPEDTGLSDGGRKVCTLGYQILVREHGGVVWANIWYPLRSCDFTHHFPDDCYLAVRLLLWIIERCRDINPAVWNDIWPGTYAMHMTSLHIFKNDWLKLKGE
jgi:hypothetical protein